MKKAARRKRPGKEEGENPRKKRKYEPPAWTKVRPPADKLHDPKVVNGKTYWFCCKETGGKCSGRFVIHKPVDCKGKDFVPKKPAGKPKGKTQDITDDTVSEKSLSNRLARQLKLSDALESIVEDDDQSVDSNSE